MITYRVKAYRKVYNHSKRSIIQERLWVEESLYKVFGLLGCKKSCTHLAKGMIQVVCKVLTLGVQSQRIKENLKWVAWRLDVGHENRIRINHLCLRLLSFL